MASIQAALQLHRHAALDDLAAMAVVATLAVLYLLRGVAWDKKDPYLYKMYERPQEKMGSAKSSQGTRDIGKKMNEVGANLVVFFGTQSGTAASLANRLCREVRQRYRKKALLADISDYDPTTLAHISNRKLVVFIVSTYGEGEPSDNTTELWNWLETTSGSPFSGLCYAALGLGNSNYKFYNAVVDRVAGRLNALGAHTVLPVSKADDAKGGTEEHYLDWKCKLFAFFKGRLEYEEHDPVYEPALEVIENGTIEQDSLYLGNPWAPLKGKILNRNMSANHALPIKEAREFFQNTKDRNCIHMELDLSEHPGLKYKTGDHLGILPVNPPSEVEKLLRSIGRLANQHDPLTISQLQSEGKLKVPSPTTLHSLFTSNLEICSPVSRETVASLIQFAPSGAARDELIRLSSDKSAYSRLLETVYINLPRLLQLIDANMGAWKALPLALLIETLPPMQARYYSISSSSIVQPRQVAITAVVADKVLSGNDERISGLCTNYLLGLSKQPSEAICPANISYEAQDSPQPFPRPKLFAHVRKSTFKLPALPLHPIIMVAAGTGIAPFRAFLQERARLSKMGRPVGRTILFFGCRDEDQDFLYRDELHSIQQTLRPETFSLVTAFSRPECGRGLYVQNRIAEHAEEICELILRNDANFYMCGSAAMAREVSRVLGMELKDMQGWDEEMLQTFMTGQRRMRRWQQDVWG